MEVHISFLQPEDFDTPLVSAELFSIGWTGKEILKSLKVGSLGFKAVIGNEIVGYCLFRELSDEIEILDLFVKFEWREKGFARQLLKGLLDFGESRNTVIIWLEVRKSNKEAISLYNSLGFNLNATRKDYYLLKSSNPNEKLREDALIFKKSATSLIR